MSNVISETNRRRSGQKRKIGGQKKRVLRRDSPNYREGAAGAENLRGACLKGGPDGGGKGDRKTPW